MSVHVVKSDVRRTGRKLIRRWSLVQTYRVDVPRIGSQTKLVTTEFWTKAGAKNARYSIFPEKRA